MIANRREAVVGDPVRAVLDLSRSVLVETGVEADGFTVEWQLDTRGGEILEQDEIVNGHGEVRLLSARLGELS